MATYVLTGANRGLGLEFVRQLTTGSTPNTVIACVRSLQKDLTALKDLSSKASNGSTVEVRECDTSSVESIKAFAAGLGQDVKVDVLMNNAGINSVPDQVRYARCAAEGGCAGVSWLAGSCAGY
jgi:NAD(P)-dependent dehydrogenase (short-subunit alcohol dehydrogenase family)